MGFETLQEILLKISLPFESRLLILFLLLASVVVANAAHWILKRRGSWLGLTHKLKALQEQVAFLPSTGVLHKLDRLWRRVLLAEFTFLRHGNFVPYSVLAISAFLVLLLSTFASHPFIIHTSPKSGAYLTSAEEPIEVEFSLPIDTETAQLYISPEVMGHWEFEKTVFDIPLQWKARFYPEESFFPGQKIVVYAVGLRARWGEETLHEQAVEFYSPKIPNILSTSPQDGGENVLTDAKIVVNFDAPLGKFVETKFLVTSEADFTLATADESQTLEFKEPLKQNQTYTVTAYRTLRSYRVQDNENLVVGETEEIGRTTFRTVSAPFVEDYQPKETTARSDAVIRIVFGQAMDQASVEERFKLNPEVVGQLRWENDRTLVFSPENALPKETRYEIRLEQGITTMYGGVTKEDLVLSFETVGKVGVQGFSPLPHSSGVDPTKVDVVVEFNQEVDRFSAQQHFSLSPQVSGSFRWEGNKMIYATAGKLSYSTRYDVLIASGVKTVYGLDSAEEFRSSFTTKSETFTLNVPQYYQDPRTETFNCNLVAVKMALAYRGITVSQEEIKNGLGVGQNPDADWVGGYGVHVGPVAEYLESKGVRFAVKTGWNVVALAQEVERGNPVILWWYNRWSKPMGTQTLPGGYTGYNGMHSEVVRGFVGSSGNPSYLLTNDPWRGQLTYSQSLFNSTWAYLNYTAIVVY